MTENDIIQTEIIRMRKELALLRLSVQRIAEMTRSDDVAAFIPKSDSERGWNRLCAVLCDWIEPRQPRR
jgi:hypothetical protein